MKQFIKIVALILALGLVISILNNAFHQQRQKEYKGEINRVIQFALYGHETLDPVALNHGELVWYHPNKVKATLLREGVYKVEMPKDMHLVKQRIAEIEDKYKD